MSWTFGSSTVPRILIGCQTSWMFSHGVYLSWAKRVSFWYCIRRALTNLFQLRRCWSLCSIVVRKKSSMRAQMRRMPWYLHRLRLWKRQNDERLSKTRFLLLAGSQGCSRCYGMLLHQSVINQSLTLQSLVRNPREYQNSRTYLDPGNCLMVLWH